METPDRSRILNDWNVSMRTSNCPYAVVSYGALSNSFDFYVIMELMDDSLDKFLKKVSSDFCDASLHCVEIFSVCTGSAFSNTNVF